MAQAALAPPVVRLRTAWLGVVGANALPIATLAVVAAFLSSALPYLLVPDSWLAFVDGRLVASHGLPHHDTLTAWTLGRPWVDQQWGAQYVLYQVVVHGGLRAATAFGAACAVAALAAAAAAARKLDASAAATAVCVAVPVVAAPGLAQVRTQCLALVPFVVLYALLATDSRRPTNRVYLVFPLLVVWANLHGSVALGAGLALVYGLTRRPGLVLAPAALLASPYGLHLVAYYRLMLLRPPLAKYVTEWQPPSPHGITLGFFATAVVAAGLYLRHRRALSRFERWALPLLLVAALTAVRNVLWFELALAVSLPSLIDAAWPRATRAPGRRVGIAVAAASIVLAAFVVAAQLQRPAAWFDGKRTPALAASVAQAAGAHGLVAASDLDADWLLWQQPALAGRVVYDVRFELFDGPELRGLRALEGGRPVGWASCGVDVVLTPARRVVRLGGSRAPRPRACPASPSASHA